MPRLREVPRHEAPADVQTVYDMLFGGRDPVAEPGTATGTPGNWWTVFALVPDCFRHAMAGFGFYRSKKRKLDPKLRELGQLRAGWLRESHFVFSQHCKAARAGRGEDRGAAELERLRRLRRRGARRAGLHRRAGGPTQSSHRKPSCQNSVRPFAVGRGPEI